MIRCRTCCMPPTRPDTAWVDGQCSACINFGKRPDVDWAERMDDLMALLDRHDGRVLVPSSGGKDSSYQVLRLRELGCDVVAITATTCHPTPIGRANIENLARFAKTIEVTPNRTVRAKLNRMGQELVGDASWPQHASIWAIPFRAAIDLKRPLLMYGENSQDFYGGPLGTEDARQMTRRWCSEFGGMAGLRASDFEGMEGITEQDVADYTLPTERELEAAGIEAHFLGSYEAWDSRRNSRVAEHNGLKTMLPCSANWFDFENLDCFVTAWHDAGMYRKFGYGRGCAQISIDVRAGLIPRETAMEWVRLHDGLFPETYCGVTMEEGLDRVGMTREEFMASLDRFTDWGLFAGAVDGRPILKEFARG